MSDDHSTTGISAYGYRMSGVVKTPTIDGLAAEGIPRVTAPEDKPWGMREFALVDPSGNLIRVGHDLGDAYIPADS